MDASQGSSEEVCASLYENNKLKVSHAYKSVFTQQETCYSTTIERISAYSEQLILDKRSQKRRSSLDTLLHNIYRSRRRISSVYESDSLSDNSIICDESVSMKISGKGDQKGIRQKLLRRKSIMQLKLMHSSLTQLMTSLATELLKELKKKDRLNNRKTKHYDVITATIHALSEKTTQDTRMRFSVEPFACDSGFTQWHDAMKMCARLPGGIPQEFRRRMWLTLAEQHVRQQQINWKDVERYCFNEWSTPDDVGLGDQIVKDLHRTGCTLFCGANAEDNQALLKRVLLGYARWNKGVGYCQGFNMLAAIILQVMDRQESDALKVMIYLIEGVLPESYFANNLRGLSVDMAVFRDLMRAHLPELSHHLELLQKEASDQTTGACYEPPLTNVFTMQWFLTLFSNCLPKDAVMRVWDLTFLQGNEMLLRTALAIWGKISCRILLVQTADEFYTVMGVLTQEMLAQGLMDTNQLVQTLVGMAPFPLPGLSNIRDKYTYNITPWTQSVSSVAKRGLRIFYTDDEEDDRGEFDERHQEMAVATAFGLSNLFKKGSSSNHQPCGRSSPIQGQIRPNLDISSLKKQYDRLRERQKQAHVILTASHQNANKLLDPRRDGSGGKSAPLTMKHLLRGKKALTSKTKRVVPHSLIPAFTTKKKVERKLSDSTGIKQKSQRTIAPKGILGKEEKNNTKIQAKPIRNISQITPIVLANEKKINKDETLHLKEEPSISRRFSLPYGVKLMESTNNPSLPDIKDDESSEKSSTSTELCDAEDFRSLSDEEFKSENMRPMSTSPRLETCGVENSEERDAFIWDKKFDYVPIYSETCNPINSDGTPVKDFLVSKKANKDITLQIPSIQETKAVEEVSLSSPTKWKWSFSEVKDPYVAKPVSPIITLHNFVSHDQDLQDNLQTSPKSCPKILLNNESPNYIDSSFIQYEKNNMFSYLFEITDISKLSNNNSENPSPVDEDKGKYFDTAKLGESANSNKIIGELIEENGINLDNGGAFSNCDLFPKDNIKQNNVSNSCLGSSSNENIKDSLPEVISPQYANNNVKEIVVTSENTCQNKTISTEDINAMADNVQNTYEIEDCLSNVMVNNIINKLDSQAACEINNQNGSVNKSNESKPISESNDSLVKLRREDNINSFNSKDNEKTTAAVAQSLKNTTEIKERDTHFSNISSKDKLVEKILLNETGLMDTEISTSVPNGNELFHSNGEEGSSEDSFASANDVVKCEVDSEILDAISIKNDLCFQESHCIQNDSTLIETDLLAFGTPCDSASLSSKELKDNIRSNMEIESSFSEAGTETAYNISGDTIIHKSDNCNNCCHFLNEIQLKEKIPVVTNIMKQQLNNEDRDSKHTEELSSEVIRRRLWAGVKCLSLDAATIYEKMQESIIDSEFSPLPTVEESPGECMHASSVFLNRHPIRRNSEAALKLMTENTKILDKFTRQMSEIDESCKTLKEIYIEVSNKEDGIELNLNHISVGEPKDGTSSHCVLTKVITQESGPLECHPNKDNFLGNDRYIDSVSSINEPLGVSDLISTSKENGIEQGKLESKEETSQERIIRKYIVKPSTKSNTNAVPFSKKSFLRPKLSKDHISIKPIECKSSVPDIGDGEQNCDRKLYGGITSKENINKSISNPFPLKPIDRPHKEMGVKLGLYSSSNFKTASLQ